MKKVKSRSGKVGLPPGSMIHVGDGEATRSSLRLFTFDASGFEERTLGDLNECRSVISEQRVTWIDHDGLTSELILQQAGELFDLHPLLLEDILNTDHRPKVEEYHDTLFVVAKMLAMDPETGGVQSEQICFVLRKGLVISFQERPGDVLDPIRERLRKDLGRVRRAGADYLLYALLDVIVDNYFLIVEDLGKRIEELERKVMVRPGNEDLLTIQELRSLLITV
jgi:magnesium transporter